MSLSSATIIHLFILQEVYRNCCIHWFVFLCCLWFLWCNALVNPWVETDGTKPCDKCLFWGNDGWVCFVFITLEWVWFGAKIGLNGSLDGELTSLLFFAANFFPFTKPTELILLVWSFSWSCGLCNFEPCTRCFGLGRIFWLVKPCSEVSAVASSSKLRDRDVLATSCDERLKRHELQSCFC